MLSVLLVLRLGSCQRLFWRITQDAWHSDCRSDDATFCWKYAWKYVNPWELFLIVHIIEAKHSLTFCHAFFGKNILGHQPNLHFGVCPISHQHSVSSGYLFRAPHMSTKYQQLYFYCQQLFCLRQLLKPFLFTQQKILTFGEWYFDTTSHVLFPAYWRHVDILKAGRLDNLHAKVARNNMTSARNVGRFMSMSIT